jgi:hypothetical protein
MKQRNIMAVVLLSIITLGIYDLFWLASVKKDLNKSTDVHIPTMWVLFAPFILAIVGTPLFIVLTLANGHSGNGTGAASGIATFAYIFILTIVAVPVAFYWLFKFSKAVNHYTHGELNTAITFMLLWLLRFIGIAVMQDKFNDMLVAGGMAGITQVPAGPMPAAAADTATVAPGMAAGASSVPQQGAAPVQPTVTPQPLQQPPVDPTKPESYGQ